MLYSDQIDYLQAITKGQPDGSINSEGLDDQVYFYIHKLITESETPIDLNNIDQDLIKRTNKKKVDITPKSNEKILQQNTAILDSATPILELETTTLVKTPEDGSSDTKKSFFTKPPVIVGLVALSTYALFNFMPQKEEFIS